MTLLPRTTPKEPDSPNKYAVYYLHCENCRKCTKHTFVHRTRKGGDMFACYHCGSRHKLKKELCK